MTTRDCLDPWTYVEFRADGGVAPCCNRAEIGNLDHEPLSTILNGPAIRRLRANLLQGALDRPCTACQQRGLTSTEALTQRVRDLLGSARVSPSRVHLDTGAPGAEALDIAWLSHAVQGRQAVGVLQPLPKPKDLTVPFDARAYREANPDLTITADEALGYALRRGRFEARRLRLRHSTLPDSGDGASLPFDPETYLQANPDVRRAGVNPMRHYLNHGRYEPRRLAPPPGTALTGTPGKTG